MEDEIKKYEDLPIIFNCKNNHTIFKEAVRVASTMYTKPKPPYDFPIVPANGDPRKYLLNHPDQEEVIIGILHYLGLEPDDKDWLFETVRQRTNNRINTD